MDPLQFEDLKSKLGPQPTTVGELKLDSYRSPIKTKIIAGTSRGYISHGFQENQGGHRDQRF